MPAIGKLGLLLKEKGETLANIIPGTEFERPW
jgi:hypothetical protein